MPWKTIVCIIIAALSIAFAAMNSAAVDVWVIKTFTNVPLSVALIIAFALGALVTMPFAVFGRAKKNKKNQAGKSKLSPEPETTE